MEGDGGCGKGKVLDPSSLHSWSARAQETLLKKGKIDV